MSEQDAVLDFRFGGRDGYRKHIEKIKYQKDQRMKALTKLSK